MFRALLFIAITIPLVGFYSFWRDAQKAQWDWISDESVKMYVDAAKTFLTASGIAVAIVVAALGQRLSPPAWIVQRAVGGLVTCVIFAPCAVLVLYRLFERARSRGNDNKQGRLTRLELGILLVMGYFTVEGFIVGFLYLGRIPFSLTQMGNIPTMR
jgi:phosphatidylglycerophosphate synthase